jgi:hypothetical protein
MSDTLIKASLTQGNATTRGGVSMQSATLHGTTMYRVVLKPGASWSKDLKPHTGGDSCQRPHTGVVLSGALGVRMDDGTQEIFCEGDAFGVKPGHDAWCEGDVDTVFVEWNAAA